MQRIILAILTGLWGTAVVAAILFPSPIEPWLPSSALFGATAAGYLLAPLLTKPGLLWPIAAAVLLTTLGASLAGGAALFLAVGPDLLWTGLVMGPLAVWSAIAQSPAVLLTWTAGALTLTLAGRRLSRRAPSCPDICPTDTRQTSDAEPTAVVTEKLRTDYAVNTH